MSGEVIRFGKYDLLERVNVGGMAEVWRARARGIEGFEKAFAIKRILATIAEDAEFVAMFIDEAKIAGQLTHANIAQIHDLGIIDGSYFIAMEFVAGRDLRALFDRARKRKEFVPVPLACYCVSRVCDALDYAHSKKDAQGHDLHIVHRDVSPQNVLVSFEGEVKLIDFGIAKAASKATQTQAGILKGKFAYMSPEQVQGLPLDGRSDIFALGTVLYELLAGVRLFPGENDFGTLENVRRMRIQPPSVLNDKLPRALDSIVLKALARDLDQRYRTAAELGADLQRFLALQETVFGPRDLAAYMRSTFAEDVAKERSKAAQRAAPPPPAMAPAKPEGAAATPIPESPTTLRPLPAPPEPAIEAATTLRPFPAPVPAAGALEVVAAAPAGRETPATMGRGRARSWLVALLAALAGAAVVVGAALYVRGHPVLPPRAPRVVTGGH